MRNIDEPNTLDNAPVTRNILNSQLRVINVGLASFANELSTRSVPVVSIEWLPPAGGNVELAALLAKLGM